MICFHGYSLHIKNILHVAFLFFFIFSHIYNYPPFMAEILPIWLKILTNYSVLIGIYDTWAHGKQEWNISSEIWNRCIILVLAIKIQNIITYCRIFSFSVVIFYSPRIACHSASFMSQRVLTLIRWRTTNGDKLHWQL